LSEGIVVQKRGLVITDEEFKGLLALFSTDWEHAGERYEEIRAALIKYLECRGCCLPIDCADEALNRMARNIAQGLDIPSKDALRYCRSIAQNVHYEHLRDIKNKTLGLESLSPLEYPSVHPDAISEQEMERIKMEQRIECLQKCLSRLPPETSSLILSYYSKDNGEKIRKHKAMAEQTGISLNYLRVRTHRLRIKLEKCVVSCVQQHSRL